ncbi:flagellar biosynthesis protein FlgA [Micromonospora sp. CPCC 205556]|uniref:flagellar biosynthesis protein FlgA n=1 Tax=Micromonospora sp. CPCC 205556 TaxID=3122398 RepID=UPI002FF0EB5C
MTVGGTQGADSLRPARRLGRPRGGTLLRIGLVAALLGLAVIVLDTPAGCPTPTAPPSGPSAGAGSGSPPSPAGADRGSGPAGADRGSGPAGAAAGSGPAGAAPGDPASGARQGAALPLPGGLVGVPVRLAEPAALTVLRPGARVDLLVVAEGRTGLLAPGALVLDVVGGGDATDGSSALYLALRPDQAHRAVGQPEGSRFAVVVRG